MIRVPKKILGQYGEKYALQFLLSKGYNLISTGYSYEKAEIDIIAQDGSFLVFVEVKLRQDGDYGSGEEAINKRKIAHIERVGEYYAALHPQLPQALRIDVVSINLSRKNQPQIRLFKNIHSSL